MMNKGELLLLSRVVELMNTFVSLDTRVLRRVDIVRVGRNHSKKDETANFVSASPSGRRCTRKPDSDSDPLPEGGPHLMQHSLRVEQDHPSP